MPHIETRLSGIVAFLRTGGPASSVAMEPLVGDSEHLSCGDCLTPQSPGPRCCRPPLATSTLSGTSSTATSRHRPCCSTTVALTPCRATEACTGSPARAPRQTRPRRRQTQFSRRLPRRRFGQISGTLQWRHRRRRRRCLRPRPLRSLQAARGSRGICYAHCHTLTRSVHSPPQHLPEMGLRFAAHKAPDCVDASLHMGVCKPSETVSGQSFCCYPTIVSR